MSILVPPERDGDTPRAVPASMVRAGPRVPEGCGSGNLPVKLDHVAVRDRVGGAHLLSLELGARPPDPGEPELGRHTPVDLERHVAHRPPAAEGERTAHVRRVAGDLRVDPDDPEEGEEGR